MKKRLAISLHGKFKGTPPDNDLPDGDYVYQLTGNGLGNVSWDSGGRQQIRRRVKPYNPQTPTQQAHRNKMADAVSAWQSLDSGTKATWTSKAHAKGRTPYNFFLSHYIKNH